MSKWPFLFIIVLFLLWAIIFWYYASNKKGNISIASQSGISQSGTITTTITSTGLVVETQPDAVTIKLNSLEQLVENFLLVQEVDQVNKLIEQDYLSSYLLTTQKILQEGKILTEQKRKQIDEHTDVFLGLLYKVLLKDERNKEYIEPFKTDKEFIQYFHQSIFTGKVLGQDMDISETIANNRSYCSDEKLFPIEKDRKSCMAQMDFFNAKSLSDCSNIDKTLFPGWRELCDDYFSMIK